MKERTELKRLKSGQADEVEITSRLLNIIFNMPVRQQEELLDQLDSSGFPGARKHRRVCLNKPWVAVIDPEASGTESYIRDISRCGVFLETSQPFEIGDKIVLKFQTPSSGKKFKIAGEVIRREENGVGVKFRRQLNHSDS